MYDDITNFDALMRTMRVNRNPFSFFLSMCIYRLGLQLRLFLHFLNGLFFFRLNFIFNCCWFAFFMKGLVLLQVLLRCHIVTTIQNEKKWDEFCFVHRPIGRKEYSGTLLFIFIFNVRPS